MAGAGNPSEQTSVAIGIRAKRSCFYGLSEASRMWWSALPVLRAAVWELNRGGLQSD